MGENAAHREDNSLRDALTAEEMELFKDVVGSRALVPAAPVQEDDELACR